MAALPERPPTTMEELPAYLGAFTSFERQGPLPTWRKALGPERARRLLERLELLPVDVPVIQVAGSKGKGSTVLWMEQLLLGRGIRPGAFMSPHLERINERTRVNGEDASDEAILDAVAGIHPTLARIEAENPDHMPTFFDLWLAVALWIFRRHEVEVMLLEVGLGGPLDSTTAVPHSVGVLTTIDLEHRRELGDTLEEIATEKAGIAREGKPFIVADCETAWGMAALEQARAKGADAFSCEVDARIPLAVMSPQATNLSIALRALDTLGFDSFTSDDVATAADATTLMARLEVLPGPPRLLLDVAHTPRSLRLFRSRLDSFRRSRPATVLLAFLADKEWPEAFESLLPTEASAAITWIVSTVSSPRAADPEELASELGRQGATTTIVDRNLDSAIQELRQRAPYGALAATGSFYLAGQVRRSWGC